MDWNPDKWLAPQIVETPDIVADIEHFIHPCFSQEDFELLDDDARKKARLLAERLEFIDHLTTVSEMMQARKVVTVSDTPLGNGLVKRTQNFSIVIGDHDFAGFDFDVDALAIYLLLTCIDTIKGQPRYTSIFKWLATKELTQVPTDWELLSEEYEREYGLSKRFKAAFIEDCSEEIKLMLVKNLAVVKFSGLRIKQESATTWEKRTFEKKLHRIATELYSIRSSFTHTSLRYFSPRIAVSQSPDVSDALLLQRVDGPGLHALLIDVVRHLATTLVLKQKRPKEAYFTETVGPCFCDADAGICCKLTPVSFGVDVL